ncbi:MAG: ribonuclease E/G [Defluviitaleaceae bacterium]|nr:ribonuclease E/G [Defluviitaleaceae bacterium]
MKRLLIKHGEGGAFVALSEGERLVELFIEAVGVCDSGSWVGRVIVGRIKTILPGQFAFIDIGAKKNAFINLRKGHGLKAGQAILVQVEKDAVGTKGMYVSLEISLKGRFVVLNNGQAVGVSRKIEDDKEARRLRKIVRKVLPQGYGAIIRTNARGVSAEVISEEILSLHEAHADITARAEFIKPPATLFPSARKNTLLSDILSEDIAEVLVDVADDELFDAVEQEICGVLPSMAGRIQRRPLNLEKQAVAACAKEVPLPCGGYITVEQTEACVVVDVNTGSNVGKVNYAETVLDTNLEAATEIAAQLRLRNLSGIIIVDFIDMQNQAEEAEVLERLEAEVKKDRIKTEVLGFVGLGMVQMTRQKTRPPISETMQIKCPRCGGR